MNSGALPQLPEHLYSALCQLARCRAPLGKLHMPRHTGGSVVFPCHRCRSISWFVNADHGMVSYLLDAQGRHLDKRTGALLQPAPQPAVASPPDAPANGRRSRRS